MDDDNMIVDNTPDDTTPSTPSPADDTSNNTPQETREVQGSLIDNNEPEATDGSDAADSEDNTADDDPAKDGSTAGDTAGDSVPELDQKPPEPATPTPAEVTPPVADPGSDFTPKNDYAFDIELADGTKHHIEKPEDIEKLPNDADFGNPANLMKAQAKLNMMTTGIEGERREWQADKDQFETQKTAAAETEDRINTMVSEMNYLETKGKLPAVESQYENADWTDPEVQKQPGVKERLALLDYRANENEARARLNLPSMSLLEAANQQELESFRTKQTETKNKAAEARKAKGAMVGGANPTPNNNTPDDVIVGPGGSIRDLTPMY